MDNPQEMRLINITVEENNMLEIELIYEATDAEHLNNFKIYFYDEDNKKYIANLLVVDKTIKILLNMPIQNGKYSLKIENQGKVYDTKFSDNKGEEIITYPNEYKIFTDTRVIQIIPNGIIEIYERKKLDKLKYEISKQKYSKKINGRFCFLRLLKGKQKYYLFNDRILYGDDNAEELFRHINKTHKKFAKKCYFVIDKNSDRIKELKKIGKVLKFGSINHKIKYINSRMIISSHSSYYDRVYNPFNEKEMEFYKDIVNKKFAFIQHGVIMNDVHLLVQRSHTIADLFITTTNEEYKNVKSDEYMYKDGVVVCTGLPRFDKLIDHRKKIILISPTWRAYLTNVEYTDDDNNNFLSSEFFKVYSSLLQNKVLLKALEDNNYEIKFLLHPVFEQYEEYFSNLNTKNTKVVFTQNIKYSDLFNECSILITDYSSIHFDVAFLQKPIIYYQFDKEKFFQSHYSKGYYDYERDGFGEVIITEEQLVKKIVYYLENNCEIEPKYKEKIENTFKYLNRENSERVYQEIIKLDNKKDKVYRFNNVS